MQARLPTAVQNRGTGRTSGRCCAGTEQDCDLFDVVITDAVFGIEQAQNAGLPAAAEEFESEFQRATQILGEFRLIHDENTKSKKLQKV